MSICTGHFLPTTLREAQKLGWSSLDVILITGDAYIDHPSFGVSLIGRLLESLGVKVGIIACPDIYSNEDFTRLGSPNWFFGITSGNLDSMMMNKTASKKYRSQDDFVPSEYVGKRPKRALIAYCNKVRELFKGSQIIIGGLEASLRRYAHYDYWDNSVRRSILIDSRADMLVYGMGEKALEKIVAYTKIGLKVKDIRGVKGTAVIISKEEFSKYDKPFSELPAFEDLKEDKEKYLTASKIIHKNQNPFCSLTLMQKHCNRFVCVYSPAPPLTVKEMDRIYGLPFLRLPHHSYNGRIPAYDMIRFSVTALRGCFGGCSFCSLGAHQGKIVQSRSVNSIISEIRTITKMKGFTGFVSDIGGPTANMYKMECCNEKSIHKCKKPSCLHPNICKNLITDHTPLIFLLKKARSVRGVKKVFIASGIRYDLANRSPAYIIELAKNHISGQLKAAPEHSHDEVLNYMRKPPIQEFEKFQARFKEESKKAGKKQHMVLYFIAGHPGCTMKEQAYLLKYLKKNKIQPREVQLYTPIPLTGASDIYYTGREPQTGKHVPVVRGKRERQRQKEMLYYYK